MSICFPPDIIGSIMSEVCMSANICKDCGNKLSSRHQLKEHIGRMHVSHEYKCMECDNRLSPKC